MQESGGKSHTVECVPCHRQENPSGIKLPVTALQPGERKPKGRNAEGLPRFCVFTLALLNEPKHEEI